MAELNIRFLADLPYMRQLPRSAQRAKIYTGRDDTENMSGMSHAVRCGVSGASQVDRQNGVRACPGEHEEARGEDLAVGYSRYALAM